MMNAVDEFQDKSVCVLGLGYVGLTLATVMAEVGFNVTGVEIRDNILNKLKKGTPHFFEPGLEERLRHLVASNKISFEKNIPQDKNISVYIVTVGTPLGSDGKVTMGMIENVSTEVRDRLKLNDLVIMRSTVKIGTTRKTVIPILDQASVDYQIAFCPERTLEGKALSELRSLPQIVGGNTLSAAVRASQIFQFLTPTVVRVSDLETAEMIKLVDNTSRDVHFAYANEVARLCDAVGISAIDVIQAGKLGYARTNLPMPGLVGGPCLEKDPYILTESVYEHGVRPDIIMAARQLNEHQPGEVVDYLKKTCSRIANFPERPVISMLGIAFKGRPATDDLRGTMAKPVLESLKQHFPQASLRGYDPLVSREEITNFGLEPQETLEQALTNCNLAVITNNHRSFSIMPIESLASKMARPGFIYDFWNNFSTDNLSLPEGTGYISLGCHGNGIIP